MDNENQTKQVIESLVVGEEELDELTEESNENDTEEVNLTINYILIGILSIVVVVMAGLFYRFYPLPAKIAGSWEASTVNGIYRIETNRDSTRLILKNFNNYSGMDLVFETELVPEGTNEYHGSNTKALLVLSKKELGDETVTELTADSDTFEVVNDSKFSKTVQYTDKSVAQNFGEESLDGFLKIVLRDFNWMMRANTLNLRNSNFASGGISFTRVEE